MPGMQKIPEDLFLAAIEKLGPVQPIDLRKELKAGDTFLIGAMLSEFVSKGTLIISKTRRGGSPFYYFPDKPQTLEKIAQSLNEKDRRTCALLKEKKVLREDAAEPLVRVGLQNIPDFSRRFVTDDVAYWRYFLVSEEEAVALVRGDAPKTVATREMPKEELVITKKTEELATESLNAETPSNKSEKSEKEQPAEQKSVVKEEPVVQKTKDESLLSKEIKMPSPAAEKPKRAPKKKAVKAEPVQATLTQADWTANDTLYERVQKFAVANKATLAKAQSVKPHAELNCVLTTDGPFGKVSMFMIALNKKKVVDKDITNALLQSRGQGMPLLVLSIEEMPAKIVKGFADTQNIYFRKL